MRAEGPVRAAVLGVGAIGRHHARVYAELDGVELVAIADRAAERRQSVARRYGVPAYAEAEALLAEVRPEVVSVAVPTALHAPVTLAALEAGAHVLVEKPIADSVAGAEAMIGAAERLRKWLMVGHVERFNPAVLELQQRLAANELGPIIKAHARRLSPFPAHVRDVGVVMDLATHELDILMHLLAQPVSRLYAETGRNLHPHHEDMLLGMLRFANGALGVLDVNWLTPNKVRRLEITGPGGMFVLDYLHQDLFYYENSQAPGQWDAMALFRGVAEGRVVKLAIVRREPLAAELEAFISSVREGRSPPVSGRAGLRALALAELLLASAADGRVVDVAAEVRRRDWPEWLVAAEGLAGVAGDS